MNDEGMKRHNTSLQKYSSHMFISWKGLKLVEGVRETREMVTHEGLLYWPLCSASWPLGTHCLLSWLWVHDCLPDIGALIYIISPMFIISSCQPLWATSGSQPMWAAYTHTSIVVYPHTYTNIDISRNIIKHNLRTSMNKWTNFFIKICISHTLFSKGLMFLWCVRDGWRDIYS